LWDKKYLIKVKQPEKERETYSFQSLSLPLQLHAFTEWSSSFLHLFERW